MRVNSNGALRLTWMAAVLYKLELWPGSWTQTKSNITGVYNIEFSEMRTK